MFSLLFSFSLYPTFLSPLSTLAAAPRLPPSTSSSLPQWVVGCWIAGVGFVCLLIFEAFWCFALGVDLMHLRLLLTYVVFAYTGVFGSLAGLQPQKRFLLLGQHNQTLLILLPKLRTPSSILCCWEWIDDDGAADSFSRRFRTFWF
ncbi:uncharacterized protein LOC132292080 [Cornus florida]|uniref:uncharacterized protein LOC132292080 n=1 Tax=Cornus florida TaxID=4283 RepID=UPI00289914D5|nr:uncharacterized protein LOC132292080 [Cornus florida]